MVQRLYFEQTGQKLRFTPLVRQATATWVLEEVLYSEGSASRELDSGSVNVEAFSTTTDAVAGPAQADGKRVPLTATTDMVVGNVYRITNATDGSWELFEVAKVAAADAAYATVPLMGNYPSGSAVVGMLLETAAIDNAVAADANRLRDQRPMRVAWTFPDKSHHQEQVVLQRKSDGDVDLVKVVADVRLIFPDVMTRLDRFGADALTPIVRVCARLVRVDVLQKGIEQPESWLAGDQAHFALVWRVLVHLAQMGDAPAGSVSAAEWRAYTQAQYDKVWGNLTIGEAGAEVTKLDAATDTAPTNTDRTYRGIIGGL